MFQSLNRLLRKNNVKTVLSILVCFVLVFCCSVSFVFATEDSEDPQQYRQREDQELQSDVSVSSLRISPSDTSGLHAILLGLIGDYNPIVKDYTYTSTQGYTSHSIDIQPDWSWIMTCGLFIVVIFCTFRFIGGIFACKR